MRTHYCFTDTPHTIVSLSEQSSLVSILRGGSLTTDTQTGPKGQHVESLATRCASSGNYQHCFPLRVLVTFMEEKKMTLITGFLISLSHERRYSFLWSKQSSVLAAYVFFVPTHDKLLLRAVVGSWPFSSWKCREIFRVVFSTQKSRGELDCHRGRQKKIHWGSRYMGILHR